MEDQKPAPSPDPNSAREDHLPAPVEIYDTTLRDGTQREGISLSCDDKMRIARKLDQFGISVIEGGWPGSNPKDEEFFLRARDEEWTHARIAAFGSTCRVGSDPEDDANIKALLARDPENPALARYDRIARIMTGSDSARAKDAIDWVGRLCMDLRVPSLAEYGLRAELIPLAVEKAGHSSSMKGNCITLTDEELTQILAESL